MCDKPVDIGKFQGVKNLTQSSADNTSDLVVDRVYGVLSDEEIQRGLLEGQKIANALHVEQGGLIIPTKKKRIVMGPGPSVPNILFD